MQITLDLTYNEIDAVLSVIATEITRSVGRRSTFSSDTIKCLRNVEAKLEPIFENADPDNMLSAALTPASPDERRVRDEKP